MRENRTCGSEGGEGNSPSRPLSMRVEIDAAWAAHGREREERPGGRFPTPVTPDGA